MMWSVLSILPGWCNAESKRTQGTYNNTNNIEISCHLPGTDTCIWMFYGKLPFSSVSLTVCSSVGSESISGWASWQVDSLRWLRFWLSTFFSSAWSFSFCTYTHHQKHQVCCYIVEQAHSYLNSRFLSSLTEFSISNQQVSLQWEWLSQFLVWLKLLWILNGKPLSSWMWVSVTDPKHLRLAVEMFLSAEPPVGTCRCVKRLPVTGIFAELV